MILTLYALSVSLVLCLATARLLYWRNYAAEMEQTAYDVSCKLVERDFDLGLAWLEIRQLRAGRLKPVQCGELSQEDKERWQ